MDEDLPRRTFLTGGSVVGAVVIAGCTDVFDGDGTDEDVQSPDGNGTDDASTSSDGNEGTSELENEPPEITSFDASLEGYGTRVAVYLVGEDGNGIENATVAMGDKTIEENPGNTSVELEDSIDNVQELDIEEPEVIFRLEDQNGDAVEEILDLAQDYPGVENNPDIEIEAESRNGQLVLHIDAQDDIGLHQIQTLLDWDYENEQVEEVTGTDRIEQLEKILEEGDAEQIEPGRIVDVHVTARDTFGNTSSARAEQYIREFEPLEDQDLEIGAVYMPFFEHSGQWRDCAVGRPAVGRYYIDDEEALNRHGDLMQGHGISRLQFDFVNDGRWRPFLRTRENTLLEEVPLEVMYVIGNSMRWRDHNTVGEELDEALGVIRDEFFEQKNHAERDGRPTVKFWSISGVTWDGDETGRELINYVEKEHGGFTEFGEYLRDQLTVDGTEPYMIGGFRTTGQVIYEHGIDAHWMEDRVELAGAFDAVSNWTGDNPAGETVSQEDHIQFQEETFEGYEMIAEKHGIDFIPVALPGFDDRDNDCWGNDRYIPSDADHLQEQLKLADDYRTTDRIDIASFNDWGEGHQIEPGTYQGESYGTERLDVVKKFVQGDG